MHAVTDLGYHWHIRLSSGQMSVALTSCVVPIDPVNAPGAPIA
jgi:hypothetical protein